MGSRVPPIRDTKPVSWFRKLESRASVRDTARVEMDRHEDANPERTHGERPYAHTRTSTVVITSAPLPRHKLSLVGVKM